MPRLIRLKGLPVLTLAEVLVGLGYTHHPRLKETWGGRQVRDGEGRVVFEGPWYECWEWLRRTGQVT